MPFMCGLWHHLTEITPTMIRHLTPEVCPPKPQASRAVGAPDDRHCPPKIFSFVGRSALREFEPSTSKDLPCRATMHVKFVEKETPPVGGGVEGGAAR
ncbi:hypothetical protein TNCV_2144051 [Trichonephila clavipes]|nr:hypothetical protein TNCV_2144051 [Trichonephila clavipes]